MDPWLRDKRLIFSFPSSCHDGWRKKFDLFEVSADLSGPSVCLSVCLIEPLELLEPYYGPPPLLPFIHDLRDQEFLHGLNNLGLILIYFIHRVHVCFKAFNIIPNIGLSVCPSSIRPFGHLFGRHLAGRLSGCHLSGRPPPVRSFVRPPSDRPLVRPSSVWQSIVCSFFILKLIFFREEVLRQNFNKFRSSLCPCPRLKLGTTHLKNGTVIIN